MKFFWGVIFLVFICSNLSAQKLVNKPKVRVHSMLDGMFLNSKTSTHNPLALQVQRETSPYYFKVKKGESVKYQLDSLVIFKAQNGIKTDIAEDKLECKYDSLGRMIFLASMSLDSTNVLVYDYKYVYSYGSNYSIRDEYNKYDGPMKFYKRSKTIYDGNNRIQTIKESSDTLNFENNADGSEYIYTNNLLTTINKYSFGYITPSGITRYFYDSQNRDTTIITYAIDWNTKIMWKSTKDNYYYDANNDIINSKSYKYIGGLWNLNSDNNCIYNNSHDCISYTEKNISNGVLQLQIIYISSYNKSILISDINYGHSFDDFPYMFKSQLENIDLYLSNGIDSLLIGNFTTYYSESKPTGINNTSKTTNEIVRYNSTSKTIMLQNSESGNSNQLQLYSLSGKLMLSKSISTSGSVPVNNISDGLYIYKLISSGKTIVGKILLQ